MDEHNQPYYLGLPTKYYFTYKMEVIYEFDGFLYRVIESQDVHDSIANGCVKNVCIHITMIYILLFDIGKIYGRKCKISPDYVVQPRKQTNHYIIEILGNPSTYTPEEKYTIYLRSNPDLASTYRFKTFLLALEQDDSETAIDPMFGHAANPSVGEFKLKDYTLTKFSIECQNAISQTNLISKDSIEVFWIAPSAGSGCVLFIAYVAESNDVWYAKDDGLSKSLCEEIQTDNEKQPRVLKTCRACHEAKYEVAFQGLWSRNTFPNKFPANEWQTGFSDLVGSSHSINNTFWEYGQKASKGLQVFAEIGSTHFLDVELNKQSEEIRTFIRAKGLTFPNTTATTYATFRVDEKRHLMSVVSKIIPSPDWFVGVSNLELCTKQDTWVEQLELALFPWDAGTNDGLNYTWPSTPSIVKSSIRRITSNYPNNEKSPFYDPNGEKLKPLAKLYVTRQNIYEKNCEKNKEKSFNYSDKIEFSELDTNNNNDEYDETFVSGSCRSKECLNERDEAADPRCLLTEWSEWSSCSASCGIGTKTRDRKYIHDEHNVNCSLRINAPDLQENELCTFSSKDCNDTILPNTDDICKDSTWGEWTKCNVTCGIGYKERYRIPNLKKGYTDDINDCANIKDVVLCYAAPCNGSAENYNSFGSIDVGDQKAEVIQEPVGSVVNCVVSQWTAWSPCIVTGGCGNGYKKRTRTIKMHAQNGGQTCPQLKDMDSCFIPCSDNDSTQATWGAAVSYSDIKIDCVMSEWSSWSPCSQECGTGAVQIRTRTIIQHPKGNGEPCPPRLQRKRCNLPNACNSHINE